MVLVNNYKKRQRGFFVLTMVLLVGAVVLAVSVGMLMRSISQINKTAGSESSLKAWAVVNSCVEHALGQMATTSEGFAGWAYSGDESLSINSETCYIYPIEDGDLGARLIKASSTVSEFTKKILINVATNTPRIGINSWEEVASF